MCNSTALIYITHREFGNALAHSRHFVRRIYVLDLRHCGGSSDFHVYYLILKKSNIMGTGYIELLCIQVELYRMCLENS